MVGTTKIGNEGVTTDEIGGLIAASKVNGTNVYNGQGDSLGSIYDVMIDKSSGEVAYAVMSFGGFLGSGRSTARCPGPPFATTPRKGGMSSILTRKRSKADPATPMTTTRGGMTRNIRAELMIIIRASVSRPSNYPRPHKIQIGL